MSPAATLIIAACLADVMVQIASVYRSLQEGQLCAINVLEVYFMQVTYVRRQASDILLLLGALVNVAVGKVLKSLWRQPRPSLK